MKITYFYYLEKELWNYISIQRLIIFNFENWIVASSVWLSTPWRVLLRTSFVFSTRPLLQKPRKTSAGEMTVVPTFLRASSQRFCFQILINSTNVNKRFLLTLLWSYNYVCFIIKIHISWGEQANAPAMTKALPLAGIVLAEILFCHW